MRWWLGPLGVVLGCARPIPPPALPAIATVPAGARTPDDPVFAGRVAGLRATLARYGVQIDDAPSMIDTCALDRVGGAHGGCVQCEVATSANTAGTDPDLIDAVSIAFGAYPPAFIQATKLEHVALCRTIRFRDESNERPPAGVAIPDQHRLLISLEAFVPGGAASTNFSLRQVVHHEVFHLFDEASEPEAFRSVDRAWLAMNPRDFIYREPTVETRTRPDGFVNSYATTNEHEDRASVFELLLGQPDTLCEIAHQDPVVAQKATVVWKRVAKVAGDKLLRQQAPCVDWIGPKKPAPAKKKPPKRSGPVNLRIDRR